MFDNEMPCTIKSHRLVGISMLGRSVKKQRLIRVNKRLSYHLKTKLSTTVLEHVTMFCIK